MQSLKIIISEVNLKRNKLRKAAASSKFQMMYYMLKGALIYTYLSISE